MEARASAGGLDVAGPEGFNRAERASGLHAAGKAVLAEPGGPAGPAEVNIHIGEGRLRGHGSAARGRSLGRAKSSEEPIEKASSGLPSIWKDVTCAAVRSLTMRPPRNEYPPSSATPGTDARVPALAALPILLCLKQPTCTRVAAGPAASSASATARLPGT